MKELWRLHVKHPSGVEETFDLQSRPRIFVGDDPQNDVSIATTEIPNRLKMVELKGRYPVVTLTQEVAPSIQGKFVKKSDWKTRLYQGQRFQIQEQSSWSVNATTFYLYQSKKIALSAFKDQSDPMARKHFWQSIGMSASSHLMIFLLLIAANLIVSFLRSADEDLLVERISIAQVHEMFREPEPEPIEEMEALIEQEPVEQAEVASQQSVEPSVPLPSTKSPRQASRQTQATAKSQVEQAARPAESMGLLALQTSSSNRNETLSLRNPRPNTTGSSSIARDFNPSGTGIHSGTQSYQVAQIDGFSAGSYQSGELSQQVAVARGSAVRLVRQEIELRGGLDREIVRSIVEERLPELQYCYENALLRNRNFGGKMLASWRIQSDGSVGSLESESTEMPGEEFHQCIRSRIALWKFPQPKGGGVVDVKYPFVFSSLGG